MHSTHNPRSTTPGLPTRPTPRSASRPRADDSQNRGLRSQQSFANAPRMTRPISPSQYNLRHQPSDRPHEERMVPKEQYHRSANSASSTDSSASSVSSAASSILDRIKVGTGHASSRTSFEDDDHSTEKVSSLRNRRLAAHSPSREDKSSTSYGGDGATVWSKVATAASTLTVSVGKAWAANIPILAGEDTPEGGETRLTKALRAYHLAKAQDPTDLPDWLFEPHERRSIAKALPETSRYDNTDTSDRESVRHPAPLRPTGLKDIYAAAASTNPASGSNLRNRSNHPGGQSLHAASKASDRLRAMRNAKRGALTREPVADASHDVVGHPDDSDRSTRRGVVQIGLPSGPPGGRAP